MLYTFKLFEVKDHYPLVLGQLWKEQIKVSFLCLLWGECSFTVMAIEDGPEL